jgi:hypothetical protein
MTVEIIWPEILLFSEEQWNLVSLIALFSQSLGAGMKLSSSSLPEPE